MSRKRLWSLLSIALLGALAAPGTAAAQTLLSQGKPVTASSVENAGTPAANAVDGNTGTRWSSAFSDPQWIYVDLGATATITRVVLSWEAAYGKAFQLQTASDPAGTWTTIYSTTAGTGGVNDLTVSGTGRYVRMYGTARGTGYGYSLWELQVYGTPVTSPCTTAPGVPTGLTATGVASDSVTLSWTAPAASPSMLAVVDEGEATSVPFW